MCFDRNDPRAVFNDIREGEYIVDRGTSGTIGRVPLVVKPDCLQDFRRLEFADDSFHHVVFDPPHYTRKKIGVGKLAFSYGALGSSWKEDLTAGFAECFRVLKTNGTLIFKWCAIEFPLTEVLALTPQKPLYGHRSGKKANTHWVAFIK